MLERDKLKKRLHQLLAILENEELADTQLQERVIEQGLFPIVIAISPFDNEQLTQISKKLDQLLEGQPGQVCRFHDDNPMVQLMIGQNQHRKIIRYMKDWTTGASDLIVTDPYLFHFQKSSAFATEAEYSKALLSVIPKRLERLDVFHLPQPNARIKKRVETFARQHRIQFRSFPTQEIHDRIWIKDGDKGLSVGTSFGGYGSRLAFALELPQSDLRCFLEQLHLIRPPS